MNRFALPVAVALVLLALALLALRPDRMLVEHIVFEGAERAGEAELRHLVHVRNGTTLWGVSPAAVAEQVERHPWVRQAVVTREFPNRLVVAVEEHDVVALLAYGGGLYAVSSEGTVFARAEPGDLDHPILNGIDRDLNDAHAGLPGAVVQDAVWLLRELSGRQILDERHVSEVAFHRTRGFTVRSRGGTASRPAAEILFAVGNYPRQLARLEALIARSAVDLSQAVHVDLGATRVAIVRPVETLSAAVDPATMPFLAP